MPEGSVHPATAQSYKVRKAPWEVARGEKGVKIIERKAGCVLSAPFLCLHVPFAFFSRKVSRTKCKEISRLILGSSPSAASNLFLAYIA